MLDRVGKEILYCPVCGEPKERLLTGEKTYLGWDRYPTRCLCERKQLEEEERERIRSF